MMTWAQTLTICGCTFWIATAFAEAMKMSPNTAVGLLIPGAVFIGVAGALAIVEYFCKSAVEYIQQAISAARAEGLEEAAKFIDGGYSGTSHVAERIRALIPTPQQTEGKP